jgi:hypothetical protein
MERPLRALDKNHPIQGFSDIGMMHDATISDRCSRSAKARSRGRWSTGGAAGSMGIVPESAASDD